VTYANRTGVLRGDDPALVIAATGARMTYDELAAATERMRTRTGLTVDSRTYQHGRADSPAALLEVVAAGATGASLIVVPELVESDLAASLADEWVTHLLADRAALDAIDTALLEDLQAVVLDDGQSVGSVSVSGSAEVVLLDELLTIGRR
jgi:hypothetical protein